MDPSDFVKMAVACVTAGVNDEEELLADIIVGTSNDELIELSTALTAFCAILVEYIAGKEKVSRDTIVQRIAQNMGI